ILLRALLGLASLLKGFARHGLNVRLLAEQAADEVAERLDGRRARDVLPLNRLLERSRPDLGGATRADPSLAVLPEVVLFDDRAVRLKPLGAHTLGDPLA